MTVLILIQDDEVDYLTSLIALAHLYQAVPVVSVMMDLSRSPHNLFALASKGATAKISEVMEAWSDEDQAQSAQLIGRLMESNYNGSEEVPAIVNNGSLTQAEGMYWKVLYIVSCPWLKEISMIFTVFMQFTSNVAGNLLFVWMIGCRPVRIMPFFQPIMLCSNSFQTSPLCFQISLLCFVVLPIVLEF